MYGATMRIVGGHLIHLFGVRSEYLAVMEAIFAFSRQNFGRWARNPDSVRAEIVVARGVDCAVCVDGRRC